MPQSWTMVDKETSEKHAGPVSHRSSHKFPGQTEYWICLEDEYGRKYEDPREKAKVPTDDEGYPLRF